MGYKETLNLPRTDFPMKASLAKREPELLAFWDDIDINRLVGEKTRERPFFLLHDGPPYANGDIHVGTAFNKILKDLVVKYRSMRGFHSPYVPGWDCHGQPIEHNVEKRLAKEGREVSQAELRALCREYALEYVDRQAEQFKRLGVRGDFAHPYLTLDHHYEATNASVFGRLYSRGLVYRGRKPIHWCARCQTALAEAEIEYEDEVSPSIYVKFRLTGPLPGLEGRAEAQYVLIWTTTPWTLPANVAVAVHPDAEYVAVLHGDEILVMAASLMESVAQATGVELADVVARFKGRGLPGLTYEQPLQAWEGRIVGADYVDLETGTGCVHIAPGHGQEDYLIGIANGLPAPMPVDNMGVFTEEAGRFAGLHIKDANPDITAYLKERGLLLGEESITHSYPHCWRCKQPVIFRATEQWFISMDKGGLRGDALEAIESVQWIPAWSKNRIKAMVRERPDWCVSRQRAWGVPIPVFYCGACKKEIVTTESIDAVVRLFETEGADAWFVKEAADILPAGFACPSCGQAEPGRFTKETDILDVWFESGISQAAVLKGRSDLTWPADLYLEGSDQHRGWFQSALMVSVGAERAAPYKAVLTHGFVVDGEGRKMSKSLGNVVDPLDVIEKSGADILRLWAVSGDYSVDVAISPDILSQLEEAYRRIRNTARFIIGNLYDFDVAAHRVSYARLPELDRWALHETARLTEDVTRSYDEYRFHMVYRAIYNFCSVQLSSFYLDVIKDRLYTSAAGSEARRAAQTVLWEILLAMAKLLAPVLAFTCEEIWQSLPFEQRETDSVQLADWPEPEPAWTDNVLAERFERLLTVREEVLRVIEQARIDKIIGSSLESKVLLQASGETERLLRSHEMQLPTLLIVSQVEIRPSGAPIAGAVAADRLPELSIAVERASGAKCERCWNWSTSVGRDEEHPALCARCVDAAYPG